MRKDVGKTFQLQGGDFYLLKLKLEADENYRLEEVDKRTMRVSGYAPSEDLSITQGIIYSPYGDRLGNGAFMIATTEELGDFVEEVLVKKETVAGL